MTLFDTVIVDRHFLDREKGYLDRRIWNGSKPHRCGSKLTLCRQLGNRQMLVG